jgi:ATP-dependent DNA helicase 2 subunit 2
VPLNQETNEKHFRGLAQSCEGLFATMAEVVQSLAYPRIKKVRPVFSYRGTLTIGDSYNDPDAIAIDVERYPRTKKASAPSASRYVAPKDANNAEGNIHGGSVALQRTYKIKNGDKEEEVEKEQLDKAYKYGASIVPISDSDQNVIKLETTAELTVIGFVEKKGVRFFSRVDYSLNGIWL